MFRALPVFMAVSAGILLATAARAHHPDQIVQETFVYIHRGSVVIEYRTALGGLRARTRLMAADLDSDGRLSLDEREAFLAGFAREVLASLSVRIDDDEVKLGYTGGTLADSSLSARTARATLRLRFEGEIGVVENARRRLVVHDSNFPPPALGHIHYYVHAGPHTWRLELGDGGRRLDWGFAQSPGDVSDIGHMGAASADFDGEEDVGGLAGLIGRDDPSLPFMVFAVLVAGLLGAAHALSPGHGKAMVAAYMVGSKGRIRDAVILGGVVTFTHVFGMVVLGVIALLTAERFAPENVYSWLSLLSGAIVFFIGFWLIASKALGRGHGHSHNHDHSHGHSHGHSHSHHERAGFFGLLTLGVAGGMVPCPTTLVVLLTAVALQRVAFGISLMVAFSLGLAATLIVIGVAAVTAGRYFERGEEEPTAFQRYLPVVSSLIIMLAGIGIAFSAIRPGGLFGLLH